MKKKTAFPKYAAKRFEGKASLVREVCGVWDSHCLLRASRPFRAWKKVLCAAHGRRCKTIALTIPAGALFWAHKSEAKCRADGAISRGDGYSSKNPLFEYRMNAEVRPSCFTEKPDVCASGIHFFASKSAARRYDWS